MSDRRRRSGDDRGSVTAELAVALPAVVLVIALGVGALSAGARLVRLQDAVADAARLAARGESAARSQAAVADAVSAATVGIERRGVLVCVVASAPTGLAVPLPPLSASSCALDGGL